MTLPVTDDRMLKLMAEAIKRGIAANESQYLGMIGFARTNISNVRAGRQSFNKDHIQKACEVTGCNANWILGLDSTMMRKPAKSPLDRIKEAVIELEASAKKKTTAKTL
jgi:hypothetical protein